MSDVTVTAVPEVEGRLAGVRGFSLFWRARRPAHPRGRVIVVHGYGEHSGRYVHVMKRLADAGYEVVAGDHRGHGRSDGKRISVVSFDDYIEDLHRLVEHIAAEWGEQPTVMLGHSMGGLIAARYAELHEAELIGLILSAPAVMPPTDVSALTIRVAHILARVAPNAGTVSLPLHLVSRDPEVVRAYNEDPYVTRRKVRARFGTEMLRTIAAVGAAFDGVHLPVLLLQGGDDGLVDPGAARFVHDHIGSQDKTLHEYPGLFHEIFNEPEKNEVLDDVVAWLDTHLTVQRSATG